MLYIYDLYVSFSFSEVSQSPLTFLKSPVFDISTIQKKLGISYNAVRNNVDKLIKANKIYPDDKKRNKTYRFYDLLDIMR